ncbi:MAG: nucleoside triphosphate pyrophosphohydrolase [bacterium]
MENKAKNERITVELNRLVKIMETLRGPEGCPWDKKQNYQSLQPYIIEEAYEVVEAIQSNDPGLIKEELGDLLLQVVFQSQIAKEEGDFDLADVINAINEKLIRRHPHVFAKEKVDSVEDVKLVWEKIKKKEKMDLKKNHKEISSLLEGISRSQPALNQAYEIQEKAAKVGFDWSDIKDVIMKVKEELEELEEVIDSNNHPEQINELGDFLFATVNLARFLEVNPELALLKTILKFKNRFTFMENAILKEDKNMELMTLEELDTYWETAKNIENAGEGTLK